NDFMGAAISRRLVPCIKPSKVFRCPTDHGHDETDSVSGVITAVWKRTNFETRGCSYCYNAAYWCNSTLEPLDDEYMLSGKKDSYIRDPTRMIVMHEPPAFWYANYYHWHYARGPTIVDPAN